MRVGSHGSESEGGGSRLPQNSVWWSVVVANVRQFSDGPSHTEALCPRSQHHCFGSALPVGPSWALFSPVCLAHSAFQASPTPAFTPSLSFVALILYRCAAEWSRKSLWSSPVLNSSRGLSCRVGLHNFLPLGWSEATCFFLQISFPSQMLSWGTFQGWTCCYHTPSSDHTMRTDI